MMDPSFPGLRREHRTEPVPPKPHRLVADVDAALGQLQYKRTYKDGKKDGPWIGYHDNGQLWSKGTFKDGKEDGPWVYYHDNGQLYSKGTYKDGKKVGPWVYYNKDGTYKDGVKVK